MAFPILVIEMPLLFNFKRSRLATQVTLKGVFGDDDDELIVWFYTYIVKNSMAESQPNVRVAFRKVLSEGLSDELVHKWAPITSLGQLRIGTIWRKGHCQSQIAFKTEDFVVNFSDEGWRHTSFQHGLYPPYEWDGYPLSRYVGKDKNHFLEFDASDGRRLIVPCLEFFYRCYGRSAEIKRVLVTYPWHGPKEPHLSKLYAELDEPEEEDKKWKVKLKKRLVLDDVLLLAHAKYELYTENVLRNISAQVAAEFDRWTSPYIFLKIQPWHQGKATLKVRGLEFNDGSFLALQIVGCSDPEGALIQRDREDLKRFDGFGIEVQSGDDQLVRRIRRFTKSPDIVDLTGSEEPDHGLGSTEIIDTDFEVVGQRRAVFDVRRDHTKKGGGQGGSSGGSSPSVVSGGDPYGSGKGVGQALIYAKQVMESNGILIDMWNAMLYLQRQYPTTIRCVEWFTFESGFCADSKPKLIALTPFEDDDKLVDTTTRNWLYFDVDNKVPRGVLVARLQVRFKTVFIVEVQRRARIKQEDDGTSKEKEHYQGLVFSMDDGLSWEKSLVKLLPEIRPVRGIVQKITGACPGMADTFNHKSSGSDEISCQAAVINALKKMKIYL